nr:immunoglobulin light chain junction region [Macaca mulatta]MPO06289.1 immunoglobulin light chain junction region [Macaca mulatta]MPO06844.1 immunoglobulin light chain junction region [Macaca mulatta]MPO07449.1 immunoglobulin light chain junction region [Macaca mulatta]MPO07474.1 immunoglobulin light chain junction region [Macaca mulatta]
CSTWDSSQSTRLF